MLKLYNPMRFRLRLVLPALLFAVVLWSLWRKQAPPRLPEQTLEQRFPLAWNHIHSFNGTGGGMLNLAVVFSPHRTSSIYINTGFQRGIFLLNG